MTRALFILIVTLATWVCAGGASDDDIPPLRPPAKEMPPTYWEANRTVILGSSSAILLLAVGTFLLLRRVLQIKPLSREEQARLTLEGLRKSRTEDISAVSQTTRKCFAGMFRLPEREMTTAEFCREMEGRALEPEQAPGASNIDENGAACDRLVLDKIRAFLNRCDDRKFAPGRSLEPWDAAGEALELIDSAARRRVKAGLRQDGP